MRSLTKGTSADWAGHEKQARMLGPNGITTHMALAAWVNFLAIDRADFLYSTKELTRNMSEPTVVDWYRLVRLGRYLKRRPRVLMWYRLQDRPEQLEIVSDTGWAGCRKT